MPSENNLFATKLVFCRRNAIVRLPRTTHIKTVKRMWGFCKK